MQLVKFKDLTSELQAQARERTSHRAFSDDPQFMRFWVTKRGQLAKGKNPVSEWTAFENLTRIPGDRIVYD